MIADGDVVFVNYGEVPEVIHTRLVGAHVQNDLCVVIAPDHDVYEEQLSNLNPDFIGYHYGGPGIGIAPPAEVDPRNVYGFRALSAVDYQRLMHQARVYAAGLRMNLGLPPVVGPAVAAPAAVPQVPAGPPEVWIPIETRGEFVLD